MRYYFAYGSNLNLEQMKTRCKNAIKVGKGILPDYELEFRVYLTFSKCIGKTIPVGIYQVDESDEKRLDRYKGYPALYRKENVKVIYGDTVIEGFIYVMNNVRKKETPNDRYFLTCKEGYKDFGFDESLLDEAYERSKVN